MYHLSSQSIVKRTGKNSNWVGGIRAQLYIMGQVSSTLNTLGYMGMVHLYTQIIESTTLKELDKNYNNQTLKYSYKGSKLIMGV